MLLYPHCSMDMNSMSLATVSWKKQDANLIFPRQWCLQNFLSKTIFKYIWSKIQTVFMSSCLQGGLKEVNPVLNVQDLQTTRIETQNWQNECMRAIVKIERRMIPQERRGEEHLPMVKWGKPWELTLYPLAEESNHQVCFLQNQSYKLLHSNGSLSSK